jgi:hypothetical protein
MVAETWEMSDPRRPHPDHVVTDDVSLHIVEAAVDQLSVCRSPMGLGDGLLRVHALCSLIAQADDLLPDAVSDARDQDLRWSDIARQLGVNPDIARQRYPRHQPTRSLPIEAD